MLYDAFVLSHITHFCVFKNTIGHKIHNISHNWGLYSVCYYPDEVKKDIFKVDSDIEKGKMESWVHIQKYAKVLWKGG
jgi:hypothetical protein